MRAELLAAAKLVLGRPKMASKRTLLTCVIRSKPTVGGSSVSSLPVADDMPVAGNKLSCVNMKAYLLQQLET